MGLDMFLNAKRFLSSHKKEDERISRDIAGEFGLRNYIPREVIVEAIYWRKSNAIHAWFVENVQNGEDDCRGYWVPKSKLQELLTIIEEVLDTQDTSKLKTKSGFFFGTTDYDEYYWDDLKETRLKLEKVLRDFDDNWDFEYRASW